MHRLAGIVLALLLWVAVPATAVEIPATSAAGWPHGRTSNDPPSNVIDGNPATWTWTTEASTSDAPAYLAIGFESTRVNRLRLVKDRAGGGGQDVKDLRIEYTADDGPLDTRRWQPVFNMVNGFHGTELLDATTVTGDGVVLGDVHSGAASLTFDQVIATGLRIAFRNPSSAGTCSSNPAGPCNHYRVAEFEAHYDTDNVPVPDPAVPPGSVPGQPAIVGRPLFRIVSIDPNADAEFISSRGMQSIDAKVGFVLGAGDEVRVVNQPGSFTLARIRLQALDGGATFTVRGTIQYRGGDPGPTITPGYFMADPVVPYLEQGQTEISAQGARVQGREAAAATAAARTSLARVDVTGGVAVVDHAKAANETTVSSVRGSVRVSPAMGPPFALVPGQRVRITRRGAGRPGPPVTDLGREIPSPRNVRAGPATATAPGVISLRALTRSKCVRVAVVSVRPARVLVTIFSGRRSIRLFGQRQVTFAKPGRTSVCILVPKRARTFDVRTPLRFAVGYALGAAPRPGQRATRPTITPIRLVP